MTPEFKEKLARAREKTRKVVMPESKKIKALYFGTAMYLAGFIFPEFHDAGKGIGQLCGWYIAGQGMADSKAGPNTGLIDKLRNIFSRKP